MTRRSNYMIVGITMQPQPSSAAHEEQPLQKHPDGGGEEYHHHEQQQQHTEEQPVLHLPEETGYMGTHDSHVADYSYQQPPSQVYVNAMAQPTDGNMMGEMEQQFQQFGLQAVENSGENHTHSTVAAGDSSENNTEHNDSENTEEDPVKLFVGQVPKTMNEEDIFPTFDGFGPLKDVAIIRDKHTGMHRGCAFVTFWAAADAERAREALHDKFTFPGAKRCAQVKRAEPTSSPENKLFVGMLPRKAEEEDVREMFNQFGEIREIYMIRNPDGSSKCAAFLKFANRESAVHAIEQLNGVEVMEGAQRPLIVKFADNKQQRQQRHIRSIRRQEMMAMVGPGGYPAYPPPPQGPPIGMPGMPPGAPQYGMPPAPQGYPAAPYATHHQGHPPYMYPPQAYAHVPPYAYQQQPPRQEHHRSNSRPREGPPGANLFVYHLPHDLTDADLATAFNPFGNVISAKVYVDKFTGESKGFGFVSYDQTLSAEQAIEQMNGFQIGNKRLKVQHKRVHGGGGQSQASQTPPESSGNSAASG